MQQNDRSAVGVFENASVFADRDGAVGAFESIAVVNLFKVPVHQLSAGCIVNGGAEAICREPDGFPDQHPVTVAVAPVDDKILHASQIFDFAQHGIRLLCFLFFDTDHLLLKNKISLLFRKTFWLSASCLPLSALVQKEPPF